jgi:hypothetical protein
MRIKSPCSSLIATVSMALFLCLGAAGLSGCERKERVLDVETPEGSLEVDRNIDTGEVDVEVTDKD